MLLLVVLVLLNNYQHYTKLWTPHDNLVTLVSLLDAVTDGNYRMYTLTDRQVPGNSNVQLMDTPLTSHDYHPS